MGKNGQVDLADPVVGVGTVKSAAKNLAVARSASFLPWGIHLSDVPSIKAKGGLMESNPIFTVKELGLSTKAKKEADGASKSR